MKAEIKEYSCYIIFLFISYFLFIIFLITLYRSLNDLRNSTTRQNNKLEQYQSHIIKFLFGLLFTFPEIFWFLYIIFIKVFVELSIINPESYLTVTINNIMEMIFLINSGISPIVVGIIYCVHKNTFKYIKKLFYCSKKESRDSSSINITKETASLFDGSVVTVDYGSNILIHKFF